MRLTGGGRHGQAVEVGSRGAQSPAPDDAPIGLGTMSAADAPAGRADAAGMARAKAPAVAYISWVALALMTTASVASLRPAPTMAVYGLACIFLYLVPAIVFLIPTSLVSAELASGWTGGVYNWVATGISKTIGASGGRVDHHVAIPAARITPARSANRRTRRGRVCRNAMVWRPARNRRRSVANPPADE